MNLTILRCLMSRIIQYLSFVSGLFHLVRCPQSPSVLHTYQSLTPSEGCVDALRFVSLWWIPGLLPPLGSTEKRYVCWCTNVCPSPCFQLTRVYTQKRDSWRREWPPTPVFWPRELHGPRSLAGCIQSMGLPRVRHNWATFRCGNSMNFFRNHHTVFYSSSIISLSHRNVQRFQFLHILINTYYFYLFW